VIATSSSDAKLEIARELGATHTINYKTHPDWHEEILRLTSGRGVDRVVEVGGSATILKSLKSTRLGGLVVVIGVLSDGDEKGITAEILFGAKLVKGILGGSRDSLERLSAFVENHDIHPVIGASFKLEGAQEAVRALQKQDTVGKIVISL
jgi:NADPH:quinone reductase-like Zn-dependent oxidoreductase